MGIKTVIFVGLFALCAVGALFNPLLGVLGYVGHYMVGPERQWWERPIQDLGIRYSYVLALATFVGIAFNYRGLRFGKSALSGQEKLLILFLAVAWLVTLITPETVGRYSTVDHPTVKFVKVVIFVLMLTHVVTDVKKMNYLLWAFVAGALVLGLQARAESRSSFIHGRLEGIGGPDFSDSNFLAAYMAGMLAIIAIQFMRSGWLGKFVALVSGAFTANTIILTRSRGALVGLAGGAITAMFLAPRKYRVKILAGLIVAGLGMYYLTDPQFRERAMTITHDEEEMDKSALSRVLLAKAGLKMVADHPLGVGVGNFYQTIGKYIPEYQGKDAHNTYIRCMTETGLPGICVFLAIIVSGAVSLRRSIRRCHELPADRQADVFYLTYGLCVAMVTVLASALTISLTYTEGLWWFLLLPSALGRAMDNYEADLELTTRPLKSKKDAGQENSTGRRRPPRRRPKRQLDPAGNCFGNHSNQQ
jgi:O-antigen ligase